MPATRLRRIAWICGGLVLAAIVALAALMFAFKSSFQPSAPASHYPSPRSALEAQRQDLDYFSRLMDLDRAFSPTQRAEAQSRLASLAASPEALPASKLLVALMQIMALADNGHTRMEPSSAGARILPLRVTPFEDGFYVMRAAGPYEDLLGGRVESIDGVTFAEVLRRLETLRGGVEGFRRSNAARWLVMQDLLYGLGVAADPASSTWTVTLPDGSSVKQAVTAYPNESGEWIPQGERWLSPEPAEGVEHDWMPLRPRTGEVPETWREPGNPFREFPAGAGSSDCARAVRLLTISNSDRRSIADFLAATTTAFRAHPPCAVILDLRGDGGGDYTNTWGFAHALPGLVASGGPISVLTDSLTFSAAITTAAFVKEAGGDRVSIVGEPAGDRLAFFSEGGTGCLPHLKACVFFQREKHDYAHACTDWRQCFWLNWFYPVRVRTLQPDVLVPLRFEDWDGGRDAAYLAAIDAAASPASRARH
jgi:hypothetical protein